MSYYGDLYLMSDYCVLPKVQYVRQWRKWVKTKSDPRMDGFWQWVQVMVRDWDYDERFGEGRVLERRMSYRNHIFGLESWWCVWWPVWMWSVAKPLLWSRGWWLEQRLLLWMLGTNRGMGRPEGVMIPYNNKHFLKGYSRETIEFALRRLVSVGLMNRYWGKVNGVGRYIYDIPYSLTKEDVARKERVTRAENKLWSR